MAAAAVPLLMQAFNAADDQNDGSGVFSVLGGLDEATMGAAIDNQSYVLRDRYDWKKAKKRGLTPQEYYGSPAAGGSATTGAGQVLGNLSATRAQVSAQRSIAAQNMLMSIAQMQNQQNVADTQAAATMYSADQNRAASEYSADQHAGASRYSADQSLKGVTITNETNELIANRNWELAKKRYEEIDKPKFEMELNLNKKQLQKMDNEIATSDPKFQLYVTKLKMGVDNMMAEFIQRSYFIDITDQASIDRMSESQRAKFIRDTRAISSHAYTEAAGIERAASERGKDMTDALGTLRSNSRGMIYRLINDIKSGLGNGGDSKAVSPGNVLGASGYSRFPSHHE